MVSEEQVDVVVLGAGKFPLNPISTAMILTSLQDLLDSVLRSHISNVHLTQNWWCLTL
jgi:hypothetical protein